MKKIVFLISLILTNFYAFSNDNYLNEIRYKYYHDFYENKIRFEKYLEETNILDFNFDLFKEKMDEVEKKLEIAEYIDEKGKKMDGKILYEKEPEDMYYSVGNITSYLKDTKKLKELIPYYEKLKEAESVYKNRVIDRDGDDIADIYTKRIYYSYIYRGSEAAEREWELYLLDRPFAKMYDELISDLNTINENIESGQKNKFDKKDLETIKAKIEEIKNHLGNKAGSSYNNSLDYLYDILRQEKENPYYTPKEIMDEFIKPLSDTNNRFTAKEISDKYVRGKEEKIKLEEERKRLEAERKELNALIQTIKKLDKTQSDLPEYIDEKDLYLHLSKRDVILGYNKEINDFTKARTFFKYNEDKLSIGGLVKYKDVSTALRLNKNKEGRNWINNQIEGYLRYNKNIKLDDKISFTPYVSGLVSYNTKFTKGNYKVGSKITNIFDLGGDLKYNNLDKNYSIAFLKALEYIVNGEREITNRNTLEKIKMKQKNKVVYKVGLKAEKMIDNFRIGINVTFDTDSNVETKLNVGYTF